MIRTYTRERERESRMLCPVCGEETDSLRRCPWCWSQMCPECIGMSAWVCPDCAREIMVARRREREDEE